MTNDNILAFLKDDVLDVLDRFGPSPLAFVSWALATVPGATQLAVDALVAEGKITSTPLGAPDDHLLQLV